MKPSLIMLLFGCTITLIGFLTKSDTGVICGNIWMVGSILLQKIEILKEDKK